MNKNNGTIPNYELVDIQYNSGWIVRGVDPKKRRWTINDPKFPTNEWDIKRWQPHLGK